MNVVPSGGAKVIIFVISCVFFILTVFLTKHFPELIFVSIFMF